MPSQQVVLAIDIGGTKMRGALVSRSGDVLNRDEVLTRPSDGEPAAMKRLADLLGGMNSELTDVEPVGLVWRLPAR